MIKNKIGIGPLLFAMLFLCILLVPAVSAQENPSVLEQGLINALNSNTQSILSTDSVVTNYINESNISISINNLTTNQSILDQSTLRTYPLENGENITFTNGDIFYISGIKEDGNATSNITGFSKTRTITAHKYLYSWTGVHVYNIYTKGYFEYNRNTVKAHYMDSWYKKGYPAFWRVENWEEGGQDYGTSSQIYGRGYFQFGVYVESELVIREFYDNLYIKCDKYGKYKAYFSET